jgi:hypothetical protein
VGIALAAVVTAGVVLVNRLIDHLVVPLQLSDRYFADGVVVPGQVEGDGAPALDATVHVGVPDAPAWLRASSGARDLLLLLALALGAWALAGLVRAVTRDAVSGPRIAACLRLGAAAVVLGGLGAPLADSAVRHTVITWLPEHMWSAFAVREDFSVVPLLVAGALLVAAGRLRRRPGVEAVRPDPAPTAT